MAMDSRRDPRYYIVGGPVQPGRDCYVARAADAELYTRLTEGDYCHVLAQRQVGKTSLAAATAARLRAAGYGVATVDLTQASAEDPSSNAGRWYYSIAYRIVRDLRLRVDLQGWWAERGGLTTLQRLREFFQSVVLAESTDRVVVFFDRVEATLGEPLAQDLFAAIRACHDARATDENFDRLSCVLLGSAAADELVPDVQDSPFGISSAVALPDFSAQETAQLLPGLGDAPEDPEQLALRVWIWTRGHPYLTQKLYRGLARRRDDVLTVATVDELVPTLFMQPQATSDEPHLVALAARILRRDVRRNARLNLYGRVRKGVEVSTEPASPVHRELLTIGLVVSGEDGRLHPRNQVYADAFNTRWINQQLPFGWGALGLALVFGMLLFALPVWYAEFLPRPYIEVLTASGQDVRVAADAHRRLNRLPGFGATAHSLYRRSLQRTAMQVGDFPTVRAIAERLEGLPGGATLAITVQSDFFERQARAAMHQGDRDGALLHLLESMAINDQGGSRRRMLAELIGHDYPSLRATLRGAAPLRAVAFDSSTAVMRALDVQQILTSWDLATDPPRELGQQRLQAEVYRPVQQQRLLPALPPRPRLLVQLDHDRPADVQLRLRSPAGLDARLELAEGRSLGANLYAFDFSAVPALRPLAASNGPGYWSLTITDRVPGVSGVWQGWSLATAATATLADAVSAPQSVPESELTDDVEIRLDAVGALALIWPTDAAVPGPVIVQDAGSGSVLARLSRTPELRGAFFALGGQRVLLQEGDRFKVLDSATGELLGTLATGSSAAATVPELSPDGRWLATASANGDGRMRLTVHDLQTLRRQGRELMAGEVTALAVDGQRGRLAVGARDGILRVWRLADGRIEHEYRHSSAVRRAWFSPDGQWLATDDASGSFSLWQVGDAVMPALRRFGDSPWQAVFSLSSGDLLYGAADRAYEVLRLPDLRRGAVHWQHTGDGSAASSRPVAALAPAWFEKQGSVLTASVDGTVRLWRLPVDVEAGRTRDFLHQVPAMVSGDGQRIALGDTLAGLRVHAVGAPGQLRLQRPPGSDATARLQRLAFSPDRRMLAAGTAEGAVLLWNADSGMLIASSALHTDGPVQDLLFTPDSHFLVSASRREILYIDATDGSVLDRLAVQAESVQLAQASASGRIFVAGDRGGVTAWDGPGAQGVRVLPGEIGARRVAVDAAGRFLYVTTRDAALQRWDLSQGSRIGTRHPLAGPADAVWLSPDGRQLLVHSGHWLQQFDTSPAAVTPGLVRRLDAVPMAMQTDSAGKLLYAVASSAQGPTLQRIRVRDFEADPVTGDALRLKGLWMKRLAQTLAADGDTVVTGVANASP